MTEPPLPRLAEVVDLKAWPGIFIDDTETASAEFVLDCASAYVRLESGDPSRWPDTVPVAIKSVTVQVAARAWRNPSCAAMLVTGPFQERFNKAVVDDALFLTASDRGVVSRLTARPQLWTVPTCREDEYLETVLIPITGYLDPIPLDSWGNSAW